MCDIREWKIKQGDESIETFRNFSGIRPSLLLLYRKILKQI